MAPMKICFTARFSPWDIRGGGMALLVHNLAHYASAAGHEVSVVYTKEKGRQPRIQGLVPVNYTIRWAEQANALRYIRPVTKAVVELGKRASFDIIHGHGPEAAFVPEAIDRKRTQFVMTSHYADAWPLRLGGFAGYSAVTLPVRIVHNIEVRLEQSACRKACCIVAFSSWAKERIVSKYGVNAGTISVLPPVLPVNSFECTRGAAEENRVLFCGRLVEQKGLDLLLRAAAQIVQYGPPQGFKLDIVGEGAERKRYEEMARRLGIAGRVRFCGYVGWPELFDFFRQADIFVLPSRSESLGIALIEALACGVPAVAAGAGAVPEIFQGREIAVLVSPEDPRALADAIVSLLADPRKKQRLSSQGREFVRERFDPGHGIRQLLDVYRSLQSLPAN